MVSLQYTREYGAFYEIFTVYIEKEQLAGPENVYDTQKLLDIILWVGPRQS
jgi:hypothetical protein